MMHLFAGLGRSDDPKGLGHLGGTPAVGSRFDSVLPIAVHRSPFAMSLAIVRSRALIGLTAPEVRVEVHLSQGLPAFHIVGLPEAAVRESRERVRSALLQQGFQFPSRRLTVNLAPADLPKDSGRFDLPIAVGILVASGQAPADALDVLEFVGELSLTGALRAIRGIVPMVLAVRDDPGSGRRLVLPSACSDEAALVPELRALAADDLLAVCAHLRGESALIRLEHAHRLAPPRTGPGFEHIKGHRDAKRALTLAAAGGHSVLMVGPPGAGKSLLASALPALLPPLDDRQALESAAVATLSGRFDARLWGQRVMRNPHHSASAAAITGGGNPPRPGEISLAHQGVLFLDELPEFSRTVLEALREPLETGHITLSRAAHQVDLPARFQLIAAMNPCPCGHLGAQRCRCTPDRVLRYQGRISGPLLDRIDLVLHVRPVDEATLTAPAEGESTHALAARVERAWALQHTRQGCANAALTADMIDRLCPLDEPAGHLLARTARTLRWSSRALHRVLRVARTAADLEGAGLIATTHVAEAVAYRRALPGPEVAEHHPR
jgi:magnesium chelatase family protein